MLRPLCRVILLSRAGGDLVPPLQAAGCEVHVATDEEAAVNLKASARPEVIMLHEAALGVSSRLRRLPPQLQAVHCLLLDRAALPVTDVTAGYDDFLVLPLDPEEVAARVKLWRWQREQMAADGVLRAGPLVISTPNLRVTFDGETITLTYKEYELLCLLVRRRGQVLSREYVLDTVWGPDYYGGNRTVDVHIRRLRQKLPEIADWISTVHGVGYRLDR